MPETSPVGYLLSSEYSESVGLRLNSAILGKREGEEEGKRRRERRRGEGKKERAKGRRLGLLEIESVESIGLSFVILCKGE